MTGKGATRPGTLAALAAAGVVLGAVATSSNPVFVRLSDVPETASAFHRMAWALPAFAVWGLVAGLGARRAGAGEGSRAPVVAQSRRPRRPTRSIGIPTERRDLLLLVLCGAFFAGDLAALHAAVNLTTAANAILFLNAQPIYVSIGAWLLFGERIGVRFAGAAVLALFGAAVLTWTSLDFGAGHALGDFLGVVAGVCYAGYILAASRLRTDYSSLAINVATCLVGAPLLLAAALAAGQPITPPSVNDWFLMIGLGVLAHACGQGLIVWGLAHLPAAFASVSLLVAPVSAAVFAWLLLAEPLGPLQVAGMALVLAGVQLAWRAHSAENSPER
ncbi:MAG: DMT family transporter [Gammaproteobacteria bacterium]|nr:DMT family transporter [Gammaproteobacteria bacterium]